MDFAQLFAVADQIGDGITGAGGHFAHHWVGFRVHGGGIEWVLATPDAQKPGGLFERFLSQAGYLFQLFTIFEYTVIVTKLDDIIGDALV